ncbi:MAG TPA: hypothetical protein VKT80_08845, partial [Chloroflexota bacterium]|nr:hypothetical protein [Chloroflexota bacterium]
EVRRIVDRSAEESRCVLVGETMDRRKGTSETFDLRMVYLSDCITVSVRVSDLARQVLKVSEGWTQHIRREIIIHRRRDPSSVDSGVQEHT